MAFPRRIKQFMVVCIYLLMMALFGVFIYYAFIKAKETCFDSQQNQNEQGVDCGGVCRPVAVCQEVVTGEDLQFKETAFVWSSENRYDILGKVYNPNGTVGASSFTYVASLLDGAGNTLASRSGQDFILPQESKYILALNLETTGAPATASIQISSVAWVRFPGYQAKPAVTVYQKSYNEVSSSAVFGEASGLLSNESPYDFRALVVQVILRDRAGKPLALNSTEMNTVRSHENRDFRLVWPSAFPGTVENVEMVVDADVYHSENFIQQYLPGGKFQELIPMKGY
ncbi:MAG: hypothetical protein WAV46_00395 [Candidatus Moraniibacteriota bacterium]